MKKALRQFLIFFTFFALLFFSRTQITLALQILTPSADQATGSWSTTPGWSKIDDDSTAQPTGDGTAFQSEAVGNNINTSFYDFKLTSGANPGVTTGHVLMIDGDFLLPKNEI